MTITYHVGKLFQKKTKESLSPTAHCSNEFLTPSGKVQFTVIWCPHLIHYNQSRQTQVTFILNYPPPSSSTMGKRTEPLLSKPQ